MSASKFFKSVFNVQWTDPSINPDFASWIVQVPNDPFSARCRLCQKTFSLSNMARRAVTSHFKSAKHRKLSSSSIFSVRSFATKKKEEPEPETRLEERSYNKKTSMSDFLIQENCFKAELIWAMKLVTSHSSLNAFNDASVIFSHMFTDSEIAKKCTLGRAKMAYLICYGLAPYFKLLLLNELKNEKYVVCFDEALNRVSQKCQMDVIIRYWCNTTNRVLSRYLISVFLGKTNGELLFEKFKEATTSLDHKFLLQVSMDGPYVNLKFLRHVKEELLSENGLHILDLGTCGLHIIHGAFQHGHKFTNWKLDAILRSFYNLFKDSPARRASFTEITGSTEFPLKFCAVRWVENVIVCERALKIYDNLKKYVQTSKKSFPGSSTSELVVEACNDNLTLAKVGFFSHISAILQPFLKKFQSSQPMVPFLYNSIAILIRQLMKKIVKVDIMDEAKTLEKLTSVDLDQQDNLKLKKNVDIGVVTSKYLNISGASEVQKKLFLADCFSFIKNTVNKMVERTSKNFAFLKAASCLNPALMKTNAILCEKRMQNLLQILFSAEKISPTCAERAKIQFDHFLERLNADLKENLDNFNEETRLDDFYSSLLMKNGEFSELWDVIKLVLTLSHGNAAVESGFSVNKDMLVENLHEDSLVGLRTVYDSVKNFGGVTNVPLTKDLLQFTKMARLRYHEALDKKKNMQKEQVEKDMNKRKISQQINLLQKKKIKLLTERSAEIDEIDIQLSELSKMKKVT